jgi:hypothetical protein
MLTVTLPWPPAQEQADPQSAAWYHFVNAGIHEGRPHRWTC